MNVLENLKYSRSHEWVEEVDETTVRVGLTDFAQHELGDLVFVNLPEVGGYGYCERGVCGRGECKGGFRRVQSCYRRYIRSERGYPGQPGDD